MADITQLLNSGPSAKRVDIVIVAEGYTQAERTKFLADANTFINMILGSDNARLNAPFSTYKSFFNASALFVASAQSGTDQPNNGIQVNTYFNSTQHGSDGRLLYGDSGLVEQVVAQALSADAHELTIVLVNTPLYGGAGGSIAWASAGNSAASELALHEIGHSYAGLQDEYVDATVAKDFPLSSPAFRNSAHVTDSLSRIPWSDWMGYVDGELGVIATYEGGYYRSAGVWRATQNSKMLYLGTPFSAPEKEAFALKYYQSIGDYLSVTSTIPGLYEPATLNNDLFSYTWKFNGTSLTYHQASLFDAYAHGAFNGSSGLSLVSIDHTGTIRKNLLSTQQTETINVTNLVKQVQTVNYAAVADDTNRILQFSMENNSISLNDMLSAQKIYLDGGSGVDVLRLPINLTGSTDISLNRLDTGTVLISDKGSANWALHNIETIQFQDFSINLDIHSNALGISQRELSDLEDLYVAFFNRIPEADGLNYWITQYKAGQSLQMIGNSFYNAAIFYSELTGYSDKMSAESFVNMVYKNALGRVDGADAGGLDYWSGQLKSGNETPGTLVHTILDSAHKFKGDATWGWVADLLDNKALVANKFAVEWGLNYSSPEASIVNGMKLAQLITASDISAALTLIGINDAQISFA